MEYVMTFQGTSQAIQAEAVLLQNQIAVKVMPLPAALRAGCGICLRLLAVDLESSKGILAGQKIAFELYEKYDQAAGWEFKKIE